MDAEVWFSCHDIERFLGEDDSRVHALRGVSLQLERGTVHAVVGPSGCGKSTLLYILGLLDQADSGSVTLGSEAVSHLRDDALAQKRNEFLGFIFQFHFLLEDFTAQENVMIPMRRRAVLSEGEMRERSAYLLDEVGLGSKLKRPSRHLSGGEQQRVAVARALVTRPALLFADEPTGNLDSTTGAEILSFMRTAVREFGQTIVMVTHDPVAASYADRAVFLADGRIVDELDAPTAGSVLDRIRNLGG